MNSEQSQAQQRDDSWRWRCLLLRLQKQKHAGSPFKHTSMRDAMHELCGDIPANFIWILQSDLIKCICLDNLHRLFEFSPKGYTGKFLATALSHHRGSAASLNEVVASNR